jgi:hypothetical protein
LKANSASRADGAVEFYRIESKVPAAVAQKAQALVMPLRFEPVLVDGRAVRANARMRVTLVAKPMGDDRFDMRLDGFSFPDDDADAGAAGDTARPDGIRLRVDHKSPPGYPEVAARAGIEADVLVQVRIGRDGRIAEASIRQSSLVGAGGNSRTVARLLGEFELRSLRAIRGWHVAVGIPDGVEPTAAQMSAWIPVRYRMQGHPPVPPPGEWQWVVRSQKRPAEWLPPDPGRPLVGVADAGEGDVIAGDRGFRLATAPPAF